MIASCFAGGWHVQLWDHVANGGKWGLGHHTACDTPPLPHRKGYIKQMENILRPHSRNKCICLSSNIIYFDPPRLQTKFIFINTHKRVINQV